MSRSSIDKLGWRLAHAQDPSPEDIIALQEFRGSCNAPLVQVRQRLVDGLGLQATSRLKTIPTIIEKVRRDRIALSRIQDIAGVRIVRDMTRAEQDDLVAQIVEAFPANRVPSGPSRFPTAKARM
jgi:Region found in RelA / SpoT proteins